MFDVVKRLLLGRPLRSARLGDTLLPKRIALAVFCSDPISSVACATGPAPRADRRGLRGRDAPGGPPARDRAGATP